MVYDVRCLIEVTCGMPSTEASFSYYNAYINDGQTFDIQKTLPNGENVNVPS